MPAADILKNMAVLHCEAMPSSRVSQLSKKAISALYKFAASSASERLIWIENESSDLIGLAFLSFLPSTLGMRASLVSPFAIGISLTWALVRRLLHPEIRARASTPGASGSPEGPELLFFAVSKASRGKGVGEKLLGELECLLQAENVRQYYLRTDNMPGNRAITFYARNGFTVLENHKGPQIFLRKSVIETE